MKKILIISLIVTAIIILAVLAVFFLLNEKDVSIYQDTAQKQLLLV